MHFFASETGVNVGESVIYQGTSIMDGGAASSHEATSFRGLSRNWIYDNYRSAFWSIYNYSRSGANSFDALVRFNALVDAAGKTPRLIFVDWANDIDDAHDNKCREAWIRRIWTALPNCNICLILFPQVNADGTLPDPGLYHDDFKALCNAYGVPYIDVHSTIRANVLGGIPITTYYAWPADYSHPLDAGHLVSYNLTTPTLAALLFGSRQFGGVLPGRYYAGSDEYEHSGGLYVAGTAYVSKTGTWTESGEYITSNEADATVTYAGSFCAIGSEVESGGYANVDYQIDAGAWVLNVSLSHHGMYVAAYGTHTVTIRVRAGTTLRIDKFLAV